MKTTTTKSIFKKNTYMLSLAALFYVFYSFSASTKKEQASQDNSFISALSISPTVPKDISNTGDSASKATLTQAALFAWQEFIALNWPAKVGYRDSADNTLLFGSNPDGVPLVWHTFRHKVEIFPGNNKPPHGYNASLPDYGYNDNFKVQYNYNPKNTGTSDGQVQPFTVPSTNTPWINLDEKSEIGLATMYAGAGVKDSNMILFLAKANRAEYVYAAKNNWYAGGTTFNTAKANTKNYITTKSNTPPPAYAGDSLVSLPFGTIEIKTAWRRLTTAERTSGRFYTNKVRYYTNKAGKPAYIDAVFGMVALHIIHKTPTAPYFIYATFEQTDNIQTTTGQPVEDADGTIINNIDSPALCPNFKVTNATPTQGMKFTPMQANAKPGKSIYYQNTTGLKGLPQGTVRINKRINAIPADIINANTSAHAAISAYNTQNGLKSSVWLNYKLINVQYKPINKRPGINYTGNDSSTYYQANSVVESDYVLQKFSGAFASPFNGTITDFKDNKGTIAYNAYNNGKYLMGGCMGCHGNATNGGSDYSFIFGQPVSEPETVSPITKTQALNKLLKFFPTVNRKK